MTGIWSKRCICGDPDATRVLEANANLLSSTVCNLVQVQALWRVNVGGKLWVVVLNLGKDLGYGGRLSSRKSHPHALAIVSISFPFSELQKVFLLH